MTELKNCPFCGEENILQFTDSFGVWKSCPKCSCVTKINKWNNFFIEDSLREIIRKKDEKLKSIEKYTDQPCYILEMKVINEWAEQALKIGEKE